MRTSQKPEIVAQWEHLQHRETAAFKEVYSFAGSQGIANLEGIRTMPAGRASRTLVVQHLPAGFETRPSRSTDGTIHVCLECSARVRVGEKSWHVQENDAFVVPSWKPLQIRAEADALIFSFSDRPVQQALGTFTNRRQA